ncbi:MAG: 30S ribosomal protein S6 [Flexistipes sinusarabici]|uniref:Small ribosomal subunit protein bS6 n=1 Tax=Flexistipes sinusarabici TaxID=2352 RepID=A0A5D0MJ27_FLESI|nr:30S ribosomal protein S6 [Flexistipes sinusarabici]TYB32372.1 MAG: 30S ribosomal protein S6 [Flexistipes sinusarabici]
MNLYETVLLVNPELPLKDAQELSEKYQQLIKKQNGEIVNTEAWGKLRLAYEVEGHKEGLYFLIQFKSDTSVLQELEKRFKYDDNILRQALVKIDGKKFKLRKKSDEKEKKERARKGSPKDTEENAPKGENVGAAEESTPKEENIKEKE